MLINRYWVKSNIAYQNGDITKTEQILNNQLVLMKSWLKEESLSLYVDIYDLLSEIAESKNNYKEAMCYQQEKIKHLNQIHDAQKYEIICELETKYEVSRKEHKIEQLTELNRFQQRIKYLYLGIAILFLFALFAIIHWFRQKKKATDTQLELAQSEKNEMELQAQLQKELLQKTELVFLFTIFLYQLMYKQKNKIITQQREELSKVDNDIAYLNAQLQQEKENLKKAQLDIQNKNKIYDIKLSEQQKRIELLRKELFNTKLEKITKVATIGRKIRKITEKVAPEGNGKLSRNEWKALTNLFLTTFPALEPLIWNPDNPFTESEIRFCFLSFFNLEAKQESRILNITPYSVYKQRTRLRQTLHLKEGTDLFEFFKTYCMEYE